LRPVFIVSFAIGLSIYTALFLSSFLVGMFKNVTLGASILGYGTLVIVVGPIALAVLVMSSVFCSAKLKRIGDKVASWFRDLQKTHEDLEGGRTQDVQTEKRRPESVRDKPDSKRDLRIGTEDAQGPVLLPAKTRLHIRFYRMIPRIRDPQPTSQESLMLQRLMIQ
jgi:hypothetical protein